MNKLAFIFLLGCSLRADSLFNVSGTFADGSVLSGSFTYGRFLGGDGYLLNGTVMVGDQAFSNGTLLTCHNSQPFDSPYCVSWAGFSEVVQPGAPMNLELSLSFPIGGTDLCSQAFLACPDFLPTGKQAGLWQSEVYDYTGGPTHSGSRLPLAYGSITDPQTAVPEPGTWVLVAGALALMALRSRHITSS